MSMRLREGLEGRLDSLEELRLQWVGMPINEAPKVCVDCYYEFEDCACDAPMFWPLTPAIFKLRAELTAPPPRPLTVEGGFGDI